MGATLDIADDDRAWKALMRLVKEEPKHVAVGFIDGGSGSDASTLAKALFNEFGTRRIPARPFFRQTFDKNEAALMTLTAKLAEQVLAQKLSMEDALNKLGMFLAAKVKVEIRSGDFEENAPSTIRQKGSSKPLIDSGQMANAPTWQVRKGE